MVNPRSLISAYPTPEVEEYLEGKNRIRVYVDLKNVMTALFIKSVVDEMVEYTKTSNTIDSSIFQSCLAYAAYWKKYAYSRGIEHCDVYFSADYGQSIYHKEINKEYKIRREISNYGGDITGVLDDRIREVRKANFGICDNILNRLGGFYFFNLFSLEADFVCHYLITRKFANEDKTLHIICSSDKDLMQTLHHPNTIMIHKKRGQRCLVDKTNFIYTYTRLDKLSEKKRRDKMLKITKIHPQHVPSMMAIIGDKGDDVPGVDGIGPGRVIDMFGDEEMVSKLIGTPEELDERVANGGKFFKEDEVGISSMPLYWKKAFLENDVVTNAYKLISFEMLIRWLENKSDTRKTNWLNYMDRILSKEDKSMIHSVDLFMEGTKQIGDFQLRPEEILPLFKEDYMKYSIQYDIYGGF